jgi:hypothetical protein
MITSSTGFLSSHIGPISSQTPEAIWDSLETPTRETAGFGVFLGFCALAFPGSLRRVAITVLPSWCTAVRPNPTKSAFRPQ